MSSMEQAVLGACLVDPKAYWHVADIVSESDFADPEHRLIFRTIKEVLTDGGESDAISVGEYLERNAMLRIAQSENTEH